MHHQPHIGLFGTSGETLEKLSSVTLLYNNYTGIPNSAEDYLYGHM